MLPAMKIILFAAISFLLIFGACKKDAKEEPVDLKKEYFPIIVGNWIEYQVDSIYWGGLNPADTFSLIVRFQIDSTFIDNEGREVNRMIKSIKKGSDFFVNEVHTVYCNDRYIEKFENNLRLIKLVFPVKKNSYWNINALNNHKKTEAKYSSVDQPFTIGNHTFDSCATVSIFDEITLISVDFEEEVYAKNIGLIQYISNHLTTKTNGTIEKGYKLNYSYLNSGTNN